MLRLTLPLGLALATLVVAAGPAAAGQRLSDSVSGSSGAWVPGQLLVRWAPSTPAAARRAVHAARGARVLGRVGRYGVDVVRLPRGVSVARGVRAYSRLPGVRVAEPNYRVPLGAPPPTDTYFAHLWALENGGQPHYLSDPDPLDPLGTRSGKPGADIDVLHAWDTTRGSSNVVIAVVDDGGDVNHPDLDGSLWTNQAESLGTPGVDDDGNGKVDDLHGWDFAEDDATLLAPEDAAGGNDHGTHVAGTIAAEAGNATGIAGVCPDCRVMILKTMADAGGGQLPNSAVLAAFAYAEAHDVPIVNYSAGGAGFSRLMRAAIKSSHFLLVTIPQNYSLDNDVFTTADFEGDGSSVRVPVYPASYTLPNILSVAASNHRDEYGYRTNCAALRGNTGAAKADCAFTGFGHDSVDLAAPGVDILSAVAGIGDYYTVWNGTSMAAPHAAGVAGLVLSHRPSLGPVALKNALMNGVDRPSSLHVMPTRAFVKPVSGSFTRTSGRLDAAKALDASTANATPKTDGSVDGARSFTNASVNGSVAWPADANDVYKRRLTKGRRYRITLDPKPGKNLSLFVYRPGALEIWEFAYLLKASQRPGDRTETVELKAPKTGVYVIHVSAFLGRSGGYTLRFKRL